MIPERDLARVERWVKARNEEIPDHARDQVRIELDVRERSLTIAECRPRWDALASSDWVCTPVARLRYTRTREEWSLYWADRDSKFHEYDLVPPTRHVAHLLAEVDRDPTFIFWG